MGIAGSLGMATGSSMHDFICIIPLPNPAAICRDFEDLAFEGSGGVLTPFFTAPSGTFIFTVKEASSEKSSIAEAQDTICQAFGLSMTQLAEICRTTRKTLYNWQDGTTTPRSDAAARLFTLYRVARDWLQAGNPAPKERFHEPLLGDQSLYDLLIANNIDREAIGFIGIRMATDSLPDQSLDDPFV